KHSEKFCASKTQTLHIFYSLGVHFGLFTRHTVGLLCIYSVRCGPNTDKCKVYGDWVLVWAVSDNPKGHELLPNVSSSHVEMKLRPDNKTIEYNERNVYLGNICASYFLNLTIPDDDHEYYSPIHAGAIEEKDGVRKMLNDSAKVHFLESCDDCMTMIYDSETYGRYLLIYRRDGHHRDVEQMKAHQASHEKLAKCLHFPLEHVFIYDGVADFCHKKSAPEEKTEEH
uniref:Apolipoprotein M n=1 Tax=Sphaeramia orbicularis TaxID=375764 RepID=A0A672YRG7_9TELE